MNPLSTDPGVITHTSTDTPLKGAFSPVSGDSGGGVILKGSLGDVKFASLRMSRCKVCRRKLTSQVSVARGMGLSCERKVAAGVAGLQSNLWDFLKG